MAKTHMDTVEMRTETYQAPVTDRTPVMEEHVVGKRTYTVYAPAGLVVRLIGGLAGSGLLVAGALLSWVGRIEGTSLNFRGFAQPGHLGSGTGFFESAGFIAILIGLLGVIGLASPLGSVTRLAGTLGIAAFVLLSVTVARSPKFSFPGSLGLGAWLVLGGGLVCLLAGYLSVRRRKVISFA